MDLGGGFGVYYTFEDKPFDLEIYLGNLARYLGQEIVEKKLAIKEVWLEPGRSLVNDAGSMLYTVGDIKRLADGVNYLFIDGGMGDNLRPSLYQAHYEAVIANKMHEEEKDLWRIAGKYCESGDVFSMNCPLAEPKTGDLLLMNRTGAYTFSMFSNYNRLRRPAVVFVKEGKSRLAVKRESLEDLVHLDVL